MARPPDPVTATTKALLPLYADTEGDSPFSMVGHYPNALAITRALTALIDVMIPGKMSAESLSHRQLGPFITKRLAEAMKRLRPEIARALLAAMDVVEAAKCSGQFEDYLFTGERPKRPGDARLFDALAAFDALVSAKGGSDV